MRVIHRARVGYRLDAATLSLRTAAYPESHRDGLALVPIRSEGGPVDATRAFVFAYAENFERYEACARHVRQELRHLLRAEGVRAIVTSRAKGYDRLEEKLRRREAVQGAPYASVEAVRADVHDLVGARVALYFPGTAGTVNRLLRERYAAVSEARVFPSGSALAGPRRTHDGGLFSPRFSGYGATHHRIVVTRESLPTDSDVAAVVPADGLAVEVQVASVLMHAWAEVEHDLIYKPMSGELSLDEYSVLDELNGLVLAGELALERLERAETSRLFALGRPFDDAFELAAFLSGRLRAEGFTASEGLGRTDVLFALLRRFGKNTPHALLETLGLVRNEGPTSRRSPAEGRLAERLARAFADGDPTREEALQELLVGGGSAGFGESASVRAIAAFLDAYRAIDRCVGTLLGTLGEWGKRLVVSERGAALLLERGVLSESDAADLRALRLVRERVLRQDPQLRVEDIVGATSAIEAWLARLEASAQPEVVAAVLASRVPRSTPA